MHLIIYLFIFDQLIYSASIVNQLSACKHLKKLSTLKRKIKAIGLMWRTKSHICDYLQALSKSNMLEQYLQSGVKTETDERKK